MSSAVTHTWQTSAAVFLPAALPRDGRVAFWAPDGDELPVPAAGDRMTETGTPGDGGPGTGGAELTVVRRHGAGVRSREVPAVILGVAEALPHLVAARHHPAAHPATACWGAAALHALQLVARGRLLPRLTADDLDAWRAGPLDADDIAHLRAVAAAMPPKATPSPPPASARSSSPSPRPWCGPSSTPSPTPCPVPPQRPTRPARRSPPVLHSTCPAHVPGRPRPPPAWTPGSGSRSASTSPDTNSSTSPRRAATSGRPPRPCSRSTASPTPPSSSTPPPSGRVVETTSSGRAPGSTPSSRSAAPPASGRRSAGSWSATSPTSSP